MRRLFPAVGVALELHSGGRPLLCVATDWFDAAVLTGGVAALLRRQGQYSSHLTSWRRQRDAGQFGESPKKRGPVATPPDPRDKPIAELERSLRKAEARGDRYERRFSQAFISTLLRSTVFSCAGVNFRSAISPIVSAGVRAAGRAARPAAR